jgi:hypothetical protein
LHEVAGSLFAGGPEPLNTSKRPKVLEILTGDFAAFIDDDIIVGEHWLDAVHGSLSSDSEVVAVSGPILPLELETRGQVLLEDDGRHASLA